MRDRTLFQFDPAVLSEVSAHTPDGGWVLARADSLWTVRKPEETAGRPAKHGIGEQVSRTLANLAADGFVDNPSDTLDTGLTSPPYTFQVRLMNGTETSISIGKKNDRNQYYVSRTGEKVIYTLGEWRLTNLAKKLEDLAEP
jgi:hypothetical protein